MVEDDDEVDHQCIRIIVLGRGIMSISLSCLSLEHFERVFSFVMMVVMIILMKVKLCLGICMYIIFVYFVHLCILS